MPWCLHTPIPYLSADNLHSILGAEPLVRRKVVLHDGGGWNTHHCGVTGTTDKSSFVVL